MSKLLSKILEKNLSKYTSDTTQRIEEISSAISSFTQKYGMAALLALSGCGEAQKPVEEIKDEKVLVYEVPETNTIYEVLELEEKEFQLGEEKYFIGYLRTLLRSDKKFETMTDKDFNPILNAYLEMCRRLNADLNLDNTSEIEGKTLKFPSKFQIGLSRDDMFLKRRLGVLLLQDAVMKDGLGDLGNPVDQLKMFKLSLNMPKIKRSPYFKRKLDSYDGDPHDNMAADAQLTYEESAKDFYDSSSWISVYTSANRTPGTAVEGATKEGSTHFTGRNFDESLTRFIDADGNEVSSSPSKGATKEEKAEAKLNKVRFEELQLPQKLKDTAMKFQVEGRILTLEESDHLHRYIPVNPQKPSSLRATFDLSEEL